MLEDIRTSTITSKGQIVIPRAAREIEGFHSGQKVVIKTFKDHLEVQPWKSIRDTPEFKEQVSENQKILKKFVDKHSLKGKKIRFLTKKDKDEIARILLKKS
ncbi:MAG: AbrB/MazE/SpoVT family DNA-binding domain-containing protein [archaeon]